MRKPAALFLSSLTFLLPSTLIYSDASDDSSPAYQNNSEQETTPSSSQKQEVMPTQVPAATPFKSFTGQVNKNKVRMRAQASPDGSVVKELNKGDMFIVVDETGDFYAVQPPAGTKGYVFRTYVLDNVVEGNRVNVRLQPDVEAAVIAQLNGGTRVDGVISTANSKWLEISPPSSARFYIAKDLVEKKGDASLLAKVERRRDEVNLLLNSTYLASQAEMTKDFSKMNLDAINASYNKIISNYADFPEQVARARALQSKLQDEFLQKKITYLEAKTRDSSQTSEQMKTQQQKLAQLEQQLQSERANKATSPWTQNGTQNGTQNAVCAPRPANPRGISDKMSTWIPIEQDHYALWAKQNNNGSQDDFYQEQSQNAVVLRGIVEPYPRVVKNKPGDYILMNQSSHLPIAFIYSTQVNLQDKVGQEVSVRAAERPNNNFAYPAYFIISIE